MVPLLGAGQHRLLATISNRVELNGTCHDDFNKIVTIAAVKLAS